jgi:peptide subunit release factor 1 (eRF1)
MPQAVSSGTQKARRLVERHNGHPVISLYLDLDPERFATPPARASQISSLIDQAAREAEADTELSHQDLMALREDLKRLEDFLQSREPPYQGARSLAVFCSTPDGLFEAIPLSRPVPGRVVIARRAYVEPMVSALERPKWLVGLVNRRSAWLWAGSADGLQERGQLEDNVHAQHAQGGWSQARYERSVEKDVEDHLREFAAELEGRWRAEHFDRLAVGGPQEIVPRFLELLGEDVRAHLVPDRVEVDLSDVSEARVREAIERLVAQDERRTEHELLRSLEETPPERATIGVEDTLAALNERRVERLLIDPGFEASVARCPRCGLLTAGSAEACPADGGPVERLEEFREAVVEAAIAQDAQVVAFRHQDDLRPLRGVGALLRF